MRAAPPASRRRQSRASAPWILLLATAAAPLLATSAALAQVSCRSMAECAPHRPQVGVEQEAEVLAINAVLGGATSGLLQAANGGSFWRGFWSGAVGGGAVYLGKRLAVQDFFGAGFLGREVASVGVSVVRNASAGRSLLDELALPVGPVRVYVVRGSGVHARVDLATLAAGAVFMVGYDGRLDAGASLSAGAMVFRGDATMPGMSMAGAMMVWEELPPSEGPRLMAHERIHLLQYDQAFLSWAEPAERWLMAKSALPPSLLRYVDVGGLVLGARAGLALTLDYSERPWEAEAYFLAELAHPHFHADGGAH